MKVGVVGVGEMGAAMAGHLVAKGGHQVTAFDIDAKRLAAACRNGIGAASSLEDLAKKAELFVVIVSTDEQSAEVTDALSRHAADNALIAIAERMARLYRWRIDPGWIVFLPGVVPGLHLAARSLVPPGGHALIPRPVYHHFKRAVELAPRPFAEIPLVLASGFMPSVSSASRTRARGSALRFLSAWAAAGARTISWRILARI